MPPNDIAIGVGFGTLCLCAGVGCYTLVGETARQEMQRVLKDEKNLTKKLVGSNKALEKAEDADGRGILLYPDTVKKATWYESGSKKNEKKKEKLRQLATAEKDLYEALFDALDYSEDEQLEFSEIREFIRKLGKRMVNTESGLGARAVLTSGWWGKEKKSTKCCLSKREGEKVIGALVMVTMAGADAGGDSNMQLDKDEFHSLMEFLKVVLCRGNAQLFKQTGVDKLMTAKVFKAIVEELVTSLQAETVGFLSAAERAAMTDLDPDDDDDEERYEEMTSKELKAECTARELSTKGKSAALVARLEEDDENTHDAEEEQEADSDGDDAEDDEEAEEDSAAEGTGDDEDESEEGEDESSEEEEEEEEEEDA